MRREATTSLIYVATMVALLPVGLLFRQGKIPLWRWKNNSTSNSTSRIVQKPKKIAFFEEILVLFEVLFELLRNSAIKKWENRSFIHTLGK